MALNVATRFLCRETSKGFLLQSRLLPRASTVLSKCRVTAYHTTTTLRQSDAAAVQQKESKHWYSERVVSIGLLALIPAGVVYPSPVVDWGLAALLPLHNYWGVNQILTDYVHGKTILPVAKTTWKVVSILTVAGLCYINYYDVGICKVVTGIFAV